MSEPVFVDASAWVAITNRKDRNRGEAVKIFQRLLITQTALVTTNWTAYEALTIVKSRLGSDRSGAALAAHDVAFHRGTCRG